MNAASPANRTACSRMYGVNGTAGKRTGGKVLGNVIVSPSKCRPVAADIARPPRSVGAEYALDRSPDDAPGHRPGSSDRGDDGRRRAAHARRRQRSAQGGPMTSDVLSTW